MCGKTIILEISAFDMNEKVGNVWFGCQKSLNQQSQIA